MQPTSHFDNINRTQPKSETIHEDQRCFPIWVSARGEEKTVQEYIILPQGLPLCALHARS